MRIPMKAVRSHIIHWTVTLADSVTTKTWSVDFIPRKDCPGWTHRVAINRSLTSSWLEDGHKPDKASAMFFAEKHEDMGVVTMNRKDV